MGSAEREVKSFYPRAEKLDLEQVVRDGFRLPDKLIQPLLGHFAIALIVNVATMRCARQMSINENAKWNRRSLAPQVPLRDEDRGRESGMRFARWPCPVQSLLCRLSNHPASPNG